jgi:hypothetical protein
MNNQYRLRTPDRMLIVMDLAEYGELNMIVCPHLPILKDIYSRYSNSLPEISDL